jgi:hypothetical protein
MCVCPNRWYYGKVTDYSDASGEHEVTYDDGDVKRYPMSSKTFYLVADGTQPERAGDAPREAYVPPVHVLPVHALPPVHVPPVHALPVHVLPVHALPTPHTLTLCVCVPKLWAQLVCAHHCVCRCFVRAWLRVSRARVDVFPDGVGFGVMDGFLFVLVALLCPHCLALCVVLCLRPALC